MKLKKNRVLVIVLLVATLVTAATAIYIGIKLQEQPDIDPDATRAATVGEACTTGAECFGCEYPQVGYCQHAGRPNACGTLAGICECHTPPQPIDTACGGAVCQSTANVPACTPGGCDNPSWQDCGTSANRTDTDPACVRQSASCNTTCTDCTNPSTIYRYCKPATTITTPPVTTPVAACPFPPVNVQFRIPNQFNDWRSGTDMNALLANAAGTQITIDVNCFGNDGGSLVAPANFSISGSGIASGGGSGSGGELRGVVINVPSSGGTYTATCQSTEFPNDNACGNSDTFTISPASTTPPVTTPVASLTPTATPSPTSTPNPSLSPTATPEPGDITIEKATTQVCVDDATGSTVTYSITATSFDANNARTVTIVDTFDATLTQYLVSDSITPASGVVSGNTITWADVVLPAEGTLNFSYDFLIADTDFGVYENTVVITEGGDELDEATATITVDCLPPTALVSDEVDRIIFGIVLIITGLAVFKYGIHRRVGEAFWSAGGKHVLSKVNDEYGNEYQQETKTNNKKQRQEFENKIKDSI